MRRCIPLVIAALWVSAMMLLLALPTHAGDAGNYADYGYEDYPGGYGPDAVGDGYDRPYLAYSYNLKYNGDYGYDKVGYNGYRNGYYGNGYGYGRYRNGYGYNGNVYGNGYYGPGRHCAYGPFYQRKVCEWYPPNCWKERECYYIHGRKYCRYYTRCDGGERRCHWVPRYGYQSCYRDRDY
jgi:hypothetical protein